MHGAAMTKTTGPPMMPLGRTLLTCGGLSMALVVVLLLAAAAAAAARPRPLARPVAVPPRRVCSWSYSRSSRRWVRASFCWMAMRSREFRVFFSSSAPESCRCMASSWDEEVEDEEEEEEEEEVDGGGGGGGGGRGGGGGNGAKKQAKGSVCNPYLSLDYTGGWIGTVILSYMWPGRSSQLV
ncbi:hypothetical protein CRUP_019266 [Coryphaenoides rupestris]|nr:hypothetical protein CRUP_019266 [Coryphaenoides rupestris]